MGRQGCPQGPRGLGQLSENSAAGDGGDALVPGGHQPPPQLSSSPSQCWVRAPHLPSLRLSDIPSPPPDISGVLQPPRPKVCPVLEVVFVLAAAWFNLCSLLLPLPLLSGLSGCLAGI